MQRIFGTLLCVCLGSIPLTAQDTIQAGDARVDASLLPLGHEDFMFYRARGGDLLPGTEWNVSRERIQLNGSTVLLRRLEVAGGAFVDSSVARRNDLTPMWHRSHAVPRTIHLDFDGTRVTGNVVSRSDSVSVEDTSDTRPFDSSAMEDVLAALPLSDGFQATVPFYIREQGGTVLHTVSVGGPRLVEGPDGLPVEAWRVTVEGSQRGPIVYSIEKEQRRVLRVDIPSLGVVMPVRQPLNPMTRRVARDWLASAIEAMGGDRLRAVTTVETDEIGYANALEQSERPEGPWIKIFQQNREIRDRRSMRIRRSQSMRSGPWSPEWSPELTYVADTSAVMMSRGERSGPAPQAVQMDLLHALQLAPEQILFTALDAPDLRAIGDTIAGGVRNLRVQFTLNERRIQLLIDANTNVPHGWVAWGESTRGFDAMWGQVTLANTWYLWSLHDNGVLYPGAYHTELNGQTLQDFTYATVSFDPEITESTFAIDANVRDAFASQPSSTPGTHTFGTSFRGEQLDPIEVAPGVTVFPGTWYIAAVEQEDGVVVIETPISSNYSVQAIETVSQRTDKPIVAAVTTSDAWPHFAGAREYVARGVPLYHLDLNGAILTRFFGARYAAHPDSLEHALTAPKLRPVSGRVVVGSGVNRIELYPVRGEGGERMMLAYLPVHRLLYASDLVQQLPDGSFWAPEYLAEVARVVEREGLDVETVFAMHTSPIPWADVVGALPSSGTQ